MGHETRSKKGARVQGVLLTLLSTVFFGTAPIFGKLAYRAHVLPLTLVALRTIFAALSLWGFYLLFWRKSIRISWQNLLSCVGMGLANGIGSLLYYTGLGRIDASLAQLLYTLYPIWVFVFLSAAGHYVSRIAILRLGLALLGVFALTYTGSQQVDWLGVMLLLSSGALYGWHLVLGQWTLADVDSRTVALYVLSTMAVVVTVASIPTPWPPTRKSTRMSSMGRGWQSGIKSPVLLAARIPANWAVTRASPFFNNPPRRAVTVDGSMAMNPSATAVLLTIGLPETSTIRTLPSSSMCENPIAHHPPI